MTTVRDWAWDTHRRPTEPPVMRRPAVYLVAAMAATLTVLLARTFYVLLVIIGAAVLQLPFPFTPRQNSLLAMVTVVLWWRSDKREQVRTDRAALRDGDADLHAYNDMLERMGKR